LARTAPALLIGRSRNHTDLIEVFDMVTSKKGLSAMPWSHLFRRLETHPQEDIAGNLQ